MSDPLDFDPLAAFAAPSPAESSWGEALEVPISLDVLAAGAAPGEAPRDFLARAAAAARDADAGPLLPARPVRSLSPQYAPPPPLPYPFDGSNDIHAAAIVRLALPARNASAATARVAAADLLVREYEVRHGGALGLHRAIQLWWRAVVRLVDISAALERPGWPRNRLYMRAARPAAYDFAEALRIPRSARPAALEAAGIPMPRDKKGRPKAEEPGGGFIL